MSSRSVVGQRKTTHHIAAKFNELGESPAHLETQKKHRATHFPTTKPKPYSLHAPRPRIGQTRIDPGLRLIAVELAVEPGPCSSPARKERRAVWVRRDREEGSQQFKIPLSFRLLSCLRRAPPARLPRLSSVSHVSTHFKNLKLSTPPSPPISPLPSPLAL